MAETPPPAEAPAPSGWRSCSIYALLFLLAGGLGAGAALLLMNIAQRKEEARHPYLDLSKLSDETVDPEVWGRTFPFQYDTYKRTVDIQRTKHGGSEAFDRLRANRRLGRIFAGYPFSVDYREERGHHYMLQDQDETL